MCLCMRRATTKKRKNEDKKSTGKKTIGVPMNGFEPSPSCLRINCAQYSVTGYVLMGGNRVSQFFAGRRDTVAGV